MLQTTNDISLIAVLALASLVPFLIAAGTCFIKFSIVFSLIRNAIGLQQVPSNMTLQGIALMLTLFVMMPVATKAYTYYHENPVDMTQVASINDFIDNGLSEYKIYLSTYADKDLVAFFEDVHRKQADRLEGSPIIGAAAEGETSILALLPAYALSEIKSAFHIGFYIYIPFIVVDMLVSNVLLALGMMMMSPVTIALPIKLILFVVADGWTRVSQGLIQQYAFLWQ